MILIACWNPADLRIMKLGIGGYLFGGEPRMVGERTEAPRKMPPRSRIWVSSTFVKHRISDLTVEYLCHLCVFNIPYFESRDILLLLISLPILWKFYTFYNVFWSSPPPLPPSVHGREAAYQWPHAYKTVTLPPSAAIPPVHAGVLTGSIWS